MDVKMKLQKSLPPLVEGKIYGYLKLVIDEVIWSKRNFGEIRVLASWWGENERSQFRPADITKNVLRSEQETTEIYAIRTSINLFEEYVKNCESIELVIVSEETDTIIGTSQIVDLLEIFKCKPYFRYVPIITNSGNKIGEIHISMKLEHTTKSSNMQLKTYKHKEVQAIDNTLLSAINSLRNEDDAATDKYTVCKKIKPGEHETYKSILKLKRTGHKEPVNKFNNEVTDKLVAQVVARAQRLRGALLKETYNGDESIFSDNSMNNIPTENEIKLSERFLDNEVTSSDESKTLCTLRSFLNPNWTEMPSNSLKIHRYGEKSTSNNISSTGTNSVVEDILSKKKLSVDSKDTELFNLVNYIRIKVESFILSPAGYRRVKSSSLSHNDNTSLSTTYYIQYDMTFDHIKETEKKWIKENKPVRVCFKKQTNQVIHFNHDATYKVSRLKLHTEHFIKFKIFVRHLNKRSFVELGSATVNINDIIKSENWKTAQHLIILNKGLKIGELKIIIELNSDSSHFEKQYIDSLMSAKENIPVLETQQLNETRNKRSRSATETHSKTDNQVSSISAGIVNGLTTDSDLVTAKNASRSNTESIDNKEVDIKSQESKIEDKVLLHGLIYVAEGQELPELNTYLICRTFWREDKTKSEICNNTKNPFYQFYQVVPLIYGNDLLERIKDNYIVIEVYSRNNNIDNLLGLTKLPVHQLYIAYRDPRVLPHLLLSKYPVVSVDGWVPIIDPVTGQSCGQLLTLVALGTAEQIALLEISRGLRTLGTVSQVVHSDNFSDCTKLSHDIPQTHNIYELQLNKEAFSQNNNSQIHADNEKLYSANLKTQECQTDISTVKEFKFNKESQESLTSEHSILYSTVDHLSQVSNVNKVNMDRAAQTEISLDDKKQTDTEEQMCISELNFNNSDSENSSVRHNFHLPTETYRSVGVGAEYNEEIDYQRNNDHNDTTFELPTVIHTENESSNFTCDQTTFRAIVEIECALHLPKIETVNGTIEPSTYVSFQANKSDYSKNLNSYTVTNVFPYSCNPKWNWKCDTKLPTELLLHDEKRLILKIWRILDTDIGMEINLERDVVIGFSAIDLSVLINGFPTVSGWFHIMDFTGKCNGQIKICITPVDNLSLLGKSTTTLNTTRLPACSKSQLNWFPMYTYEMHSGNAERNNTNYTLPAAVQEEEKSIHSANHINDSTMHTALEDVSMSFLSLSLKQKLTELDEITQRLESRLRDVTNTAFEDELDHEFDLNEPNSDNENTEFKTDDPTVPIATANYGNRMCQLSQVDRRLFQNTVTKENENQNVSRETDDQTSLPKTYVSCNKATVSEIQKSNSYSKRNLANDNCQEQHQSEHPMRNVRTLEDTFADYPERGTKTHINYLLDKLSLQFPVQSHLTKTVPMRKSVTNLLTNLQQSNNNTQESGKCNKEVRMCTIPTETNDINKQVVKNLESTVTDCATKDAVDICDNRRSPEVSTNSQLANRMSTVIREELIAEENSNTLKCDELTTYLLTSNIRHMDLNNIFNPLLYQHLVPDLHYSNASPEEEAIKQLDSRYSKVFSTSIGNRLNKVCNLVEANEHFENTEFFRTTPSGVSENIDDSIDLTVLHKTSYNDLLASNSTDSTTTISGEKSLIKSIDSQITENCDSTSSETSVLVLSRQAPDGGNPMEDNRKPLIMQQKDDIQDSSSNTYN
ncbi:C2 domain-containing protein 3 [Anthophora retusa]